ncbi:MAG: GlmU family protein [Bacteroidales bacterium]|nr:GlmU family protein [Bacteroidales bacterium]
MNYILFDGKNRDNLLPLTYTRPVCELRVGIMTVRQKWERYLNCRVYTMTEDYLSAKYPMCHTDEDMVFIDGGMLADRDLVSAVKSLQTGQMLIWAEKEQIIAMCVDRNQYGKINQEDFHIKEYTGKVSYVNSLASIFLLNESELKKDFELITAGRQSCKLNESNRLVGSENIFVEQGAEAEFAIIDASSGPVYIGRDCKIAAGAIIKGPFAMLDGSQVKMGSRIYDATTIGPHCKVGGEVENVVFLGYANKAHEGFFGNSVIGHWCNIGADSNCSNLKNTYQEVKLWSIAKNKFVPTGTIFCGTIMADHSKCGINTMFNTGTVIGVNCNLFGAGLHRNYVPSFSWGGASGMQVYDIEKALQVARTVQLRRNIEMTQQDEDILRYVYNQTLKTDTEK